MCRIRQCEVYASLPAQLLTRDESRMREEQAVVLTCKSRAVSSGSGGRGTCERDTEGEGHSHGLQDLVDRNREGDHEEKEDEEDEGCWDGIY
jgi:hypothetical protein